MLPISPKTNQTTSDTISLLVKIRIMNATTFRTKVFKRAHELVKSTGKSFAVCLSRAWMIYRLVKRMTTTIVKFTYEKKDGTLRTAYGTLMNTKDKIKGTGKINFKAVPYFDTEKKAFRSFSTDNLVSIF